MKRIEYNAPVVLSFVLLSGGVLLLSSLTGGRSNQLLFSVYRASLRSPLTYLRMFGHVLGHGSWSHYLNNMLLLLLVGPGLEEKYGSRRLLQAIVITAGVTGVVHFILFPGTVLLGASGVVFMMILLSSFTGRRDSVPLTMLLVAALYLGQELLAGLAVQDNISQLTHLLGGVIGIVLGFAWRSGGKAPGKRR